MTDREVMQQALEALENIYLTLPPESVLAKSLNHRTTALKAALEQQAEPVQEPVAPKCGAIIEVFGKDWRLEYMSLPVGKHKLYTQQYNYTTPPQRQWQGLTDEDFLEACQIAERGNYLLAFQRIQIKLKEKNT